MTMKTLTAGLTACFLLYVSAGKAIERRITDADINTRVLLLDEDTGRLRQVSDQRAFYDGQRFKLSVRPNQSGYLYVLCLSSLGDVKLLHPATPSANRVERGQWASFPENAWFRFDQDAGTEKVYVVLSPRPIAELDEAAAKGGELSLPALDRYVAPAAEAEGGQPLRGIAVVSEAPWGVKELQFRHEAGNR